jgi:undecaprenyl-diphosphatase
VLLSATAYELWQARAELHTTDVTPVIICCVAAFISALLAIKLLRYVSRHSFAAFAWYRIVFGVVVLGTAWSGVVEW